MAKISKGEVFLIVAVISLVTLLTYDIWSPYFIKPPAPKAPTPWVGSLQLVVYTQTATTPRTTISITPQWYRYVADSWFNVGSGNMTVNLQVQDQGILYMVLESTSCYIDDELVKQANSAFLVPGEEVQYIDVDNDGYLEHVFKLKFTEENLGATIGQATTPQAGIYAYGWIYDSGIAFNSPANQTGIGTSPTDVYINWKLSWSAQNRAIKVYQLYIVTNATTEDEIKVTQISSVLGTFSGTAIQWQETQQRWWVSQTALGVTQEDEPHALFIQYPREQNPDFAYFNVKVHCDFVSASTCYSLTIYLKIVTPSGGTSTISSTVTLTS